MADWQQCIVSYLDLVSIKKLIDKAGSAGSNAMREFHALIQREILDLNSLPHHQHAYVWNDSILLLSFTDAGHAHFGTIIKEIDDLKKKIDKQWMSYAISVKGIAFPPPMLQQGRQEKFVYLHISSYALTNCFIIEEELGKKYRKSWYVDSRIAKHIKVPAWSKKEAVKMMPTGRKRFVFMYDDYLWNGSQHLHPRDAIWPRG